MFIGHWRMKKKNFGKVENEKNVKFTLQKKVEFYKAENSGP